MATKTRRGSWRKVAPGQYAKNIGSYGNIEYGATVRVSFVPFTTCNIIDANGVHVAIPTQADAKKYIAAAKKVYTKDTDAETARLQKRTTSRTKPTSALPKWKPGNTTFKSGELLSDFSSRESMAYERKLATTDTKRRSRAHSIWLSGKESGTPRDIYLRLYAADAKKYRK